MMKVPLNDLEEKVIPIGVNEGLSILKASLTSTSALTNGLSQYITKALLGKQEIVEVEKATLKLPLLEHEAELQKDTVMEPNDEKPLEEAKSAKEGHDIGQQSQQNLVATEMGCSGSSENLQAHEKERESGCLAQDRNYMPAIKSTFFKPDMTINRFNHGPKSYSDQTTLKTTLNKKSSKKRKAARKQPKPGRKLAVNQLLL